MDMAALAQETLTIVDTGAYTGPSGQTVRLGPAVRAAIDGTRVYRPEELDALVARTAPQGGPQARIEVTGESTSEAGRRLRAEVRRPVAVLNFASACNVGGGFLSGARAQEEELCRASGLYRCLEQAPAYYAANRAVRSALYTDHAIWSPDVPFFRDGKRALLDEAFLLSVITSPAPNTGAVLDRQPDAGQAIRETFIRRAAQVLAIAEEQGHDVVVLGAWGCGAFRGDPAIAAEAFARALEGRFSRSFSHIVFAVMVNRPLDRDNLQAFRRRFG